ncbi:drug/metabolite transporter (DMT)-like permease [Sporomusaceae bacterium BoRhaA]|uniref:DMT family transporter n=1 Tax=Pelorhabdus rhamnosifermentans TaxID=2772457 RepID=UPI001C063E19|nr:DMT family transporter [Pelorhabdus rhamnosifermentans]MBU2700267.1 drug/metabolite transporter (DMT)-like permease [Pelorhabdus rhamnosifermentans]
MMSKASIYIVASAIIFSTMEIAGKLLATDINPLQLTFLRFFIGALVLLPSTIQIMIHKQIKLTRTDLGYFFLTGFLGIVISMSFFQLALIFTPASTVAVIFSTNPIFMIPLAYFLLKEKPTKNTIISLIFSIIGLACILNPFSISTDYKGILLSILSAITFSLYCVIGKMKFAKYGSLVMNCLTFLAGDLILFLLIYLSNLSPWIRMNENTPFEFLAHISFWKGITYSNLAVLLYLGVIVTGFGYLLYFLAIDVTSATTASIIFFIKPALAPLLALIILKENIAFHTGIGILLILISSYSTLQSIIRPTNHSTVSTMKISHQH